MFLVKSFAVIAVIVTAFFAYTFTDGNPIENMANYSDYTRNAVLVASSNFDFMYGKLLMESEVYSRIPRAIWPDKPEERDVLYFLAQSFRAKLLKELPRNRGKLTTSTKELSLRAKELLVDLANISLEIAQMAVTPENGDTLPAWFIVEASKDIPAQR